MQDDLNKLIDELLERELRPNTREDLGTFRKELAAGTLSKDDARYIRGLHARVIGGGVPKAPDQADDDDHTAPDEVARLQAELAQSRQREQALAAEVAELRKEIDALKAGKA
jgi:septal ring factor EnvC (AmiA/AmiB activator)